MSVPLFPPRRDSDLLIWSANFAARIAVSPAHFGLDAAQASVFADLQSAYDAALSLSTSPSTNSRANVIAKNAAREELLNAQSGAWELVRIVQAFPGTTDAMRGELGLRTMDTSRSPVGVPTSPPGLSILATVGRLVKIRLRDLENPERRGKPVGVDGAAIVYHVGQSASTDPAQWIFASITARPLVDLELPATIPAGSKIWLAAFWFNTRKEPGPTSSPRSTIIGEGLALAA